jgi:tetratricopeptide (TPR) repeat protein
MADMKDNILISNLRRCLPLLICVMLLGCRPRVFDENVLETLAQMKDFTYKNKPVPKQTIEEIKSTILMFEKNIADAAKAKGELALYYKMLANKFLEIEDLKQAIANLKQRQEGTSEPTQNTEGYLDVLIVKYVNEQMYNEALTNLHRAIEITPENPILFELAGSCAAHMAKAMVASDQQAMRRTLYGDSYSYYMRAIELDPGYVDALKGLAVLLIFELDRAPEAEQYLLRILEKEKKNTEAMALLGRVYYQEQRWEDALAQYEQIEAITTNQVMKDEAAKNIRTIKENAHEQSQ